MWQAYATATLATCLDVGASPSSCQRKGMAFRNIPAGFSYALEKIQTQKAAATAAGMPTLDFAAMLVGLRTLVDGGKVFASFDEVMQLTLPYFA